MAASVRPETSGRNYNYLVRIYISWCGEQVPIVEPFTAPVTAVANFLAWVHSNRDLGQSAVASFRSAISKIHMGFQGLPMGKSGAISNLIKGIGNADPDRKARKPRYEDTWDVAPVLDALAGLHPPQSLSVMDLSMKTLALVAMATISRSSTLGIMSRSFSHLENEKEGGDLQLFVDFLPGSQEKTGRNRRGVFVPILAEEEALDPVLYLLAYRSRVVTIKRAESEQICSPLWVSSRKPHSPVKPVTLASWLRKAMEKGGVDTSKYKAHSVRAAAPAHLRKEKALSLSQVLARGGWKASAEGKSRTFMVFYERSAVA